MQIDNFLAIALSNIFNIGSHSVEMIQINSDTYAIAVNRLYDIVSCFKTIDGKCTRSDEFQSEGNAVRLTQICHLVNHLNSIFLDFRDGSVLFNVKAWN